MRTSQIGPLSVVSFLLFATAIHAQQPPSAASATPTRDIQAVAALQAAVKAMAAGGVLPSDSTVTGTVNETVGPQDQEGKIQILTRGTGESLETIDLPDLSQTTIYSYWLAGQTTGSAAQQQLSGQLAVTSQSVFYPLSFLAGALSNPDASLQYVGQETVDGTTTQHIRVWNTFASKPRLEMLAPFSIHDVWINSSNGLPMKVSFIRQDASGRASKTLVEVEFSNYEQSAGFSYPSQISESLNGTPWLTISIQSMSFNTGLQEIQFQVNCSTN